MFRATTFLIVLVLAGAPAASLACDLWCMSALAQEHRRIVGCHRDSVGATASQQIAAVSSECHGAISGTLFVADSRSQIPDPSTAPVSNTPHLVVILTGDLASTRAHAFQVSVAPSALRSVLRI
jgi:hypothetical protein